MKKEKKNKTINIRVSQTEYDILMDIKKQNNRSISEILRQNIIFEGLILVSNGK